MSRGDPVTVSGAVNTVLAGTYTLTYNAVNSSGIHATPVTRTVIVEGVVLPLTTTVNVGGGGAAYNLAINNGASTATSTSVVLSLYGTAAYTMELSNTPDFASATWIPYGTILSWTLSSATGTKTVYVRYRAVSGTLVGSAEASIDLTAPSSTSTSVSTATNASTTTGMSQSQLQALLVQLQSQLQTLLKEAAAQGNIPGVSSAPSPSSFTRDLGLWDTGTDVTALQQFLISQDVGPMARKLAAHGTTQTFGTLTLNALIELQKKNNITPAQGYFGPKTRAWAATESKL